MSFVSLTFDLATVTSWRGQQGKAKKVHNSAAFMMNQRARHTRVYYFSSGQNENEIFSLDTTKWGGRFAKMEAEEK